MKIGQEPYANLCLTIQSGFSTSCEFSFPSFILLSVLSSSSLLPPAYQHTITTHTILPTRFSKNPHAGRVPPDATTPSKPSEKQNNNNNNAPDAPRSRIPPLPRPLAPRILWPTKPIPRTLHRRRRNTPKARLSRTNSIAPWVRMARLAHTRLPIARINNVPKSIRSHLAIISRAHARGISKKNRHRRSRTAASDDRPSSCSRRDVAPARSRPLQARCGSDEISSSKTIARCSVYYCSGCGG